MKFNRSMYSIRLKCTYIIIYLYTYLFIFYIYILYIHIYYKYKINKYQYSVLCARITSVKIINLKTTEGLILPIPRQIQTPLLSPREPSHSKRDIEWRHRSVPTTRWRPAGDFQGPNDINYGSAGRWAA